MIYIYTIRLRAEHNFPKSQLRTQLYPESFDAGGSHTFIQQFLDTIDACRPTYVLTVLDTIACGGVSGERVRDFS